MKPINSRSHKGAFTLIELLVVIAIIAILAAILFPVFAQAKLAAKKTQALSNVKNIGLSHHLYCGDYDDVTPKLGSGPDWTDQLYPYIKNTQIFVDPMRNDVRGGCVAATAPTDSPGCIYAGYGYNWGPIQRRGGGLLLRQVQDPNIPTTNYLPGISMTSIVSPADMFAYGESYDTPRITMTSTFLQCTFGGVTQSQERYGGKWPTAFADGHAKTIAWKGGWGMAGAEGSRFAVPANLNLITDYCYDPTFALSATTWNGGNDGVTDVPDGILCNQLPALFAAFPVSATNTGTPTFLP